VESDDGVTRRVVLDATISLCWVVAPQDATGLYQQIHGPMHQDVARCLDLLGNILYQAGDQEVGVLQTQKALAMHWQTGGIDCYEAINDLSTLSHFMQGMGGRVDMAIKYLRACTYLLELVAGPSHPEIAALYLKLGQLFQEVGQGAQTYKCYMIALERSKLGYDRLQEAQCSHQVGMEGAGGPALAGEQPDDLWMMTFLTGGTAGGGAGDVQGRARSREAVVPDPQVHVWRGGPAHDRLVARHEHLHAKGGGEGHGPPSPSQPVQRHRDGHARRRVDGGQWEWRSGGGRRGRYQASRVDRQREGQEEDRKQEEMSFLTLCVCCLPEV
jgi:hypothetical protein